MRVLITGGTGLIGKYLQEKLLHIGYEVIVLSRSNRTSKTRNLTYAKWDVAKGYIDVEALCSANQIIHLAGANIADGRWTEKRKKELIDSRVATANLIYNTLKDNEHQVNSFIAASGADCYGLQTLDKIHTEDDGFGNDFLAKVCKVWEEATFQFKTLGIRTVCLRTGVVFAPEKSALQKMAQPIRYGFGAPLGSGNQIMSIIHIRDLSNMYIDTLQNKEIEGVYNAISVNETNKTITKAIAKQLKKPLFLPNIPSFVLHLLLGDMAKILLEGSALSNAKIKNTGFNFSYPTLERILKDVL